MRNYGIRLHKFAFLCFRFCELVKPDPVYSHERLVLKHKPKKVAVIAAMLKLLLIAHTIYKNKMVYVPG